MKPTQEFFPSSMLLGALQESYHLPEEGGGRNMPKSGSIEWIDAD